MNQNELQLIKQAILNEIEGYEFYKLAANQTQEPETKAAFLALVAEEMTHVEWLKELFVTMKENRTEDFDLAAVQDPPAPNLYKWENLDRKHADLAVSVFSIGMQMEQAAIKYYENAMRETGNNFAKAVYEKLIAWEKQHFIQFSEEYEVLKREWWDTQSFAPF